MKKSQPITYRIAGPHPKQRSFTEIPDNYQKYYVITSSNNLSSPLSFILIFGYINALSTDVSNLRKFENDLRSKSIPELNSTTEIENWLRTISSQPNSWIKSLETNSVLQTDLEKMLMNGCHIDPNEKFEPIYFPAAANILQCSILFYQPYTYQKLLITPDSEDSKCLVLIEMDYDNLFKLYIEDNTPPIKNGYLDKKIKLKELITRKLVEEEDDNYQIFEKIFAKEDISAELIKNKHKRLEEFNSLVDELIDLKKKEGKKRGVDSKLVEYLVQIKRENDDIVQSLRLFKPKKVKNDEEEEKIVSIKDDLKIPCMDCRKISEKICELKCGHTICDDCLISRINDLKSSNKAFLVKCQIPYCYCIISLKQIAEFLGKPTADQIRNYNSSKASPDYCLICQKKSDVKLHDNHALCKDCILSYVKHFTDFEMIKVDPTTKSINPIECPYYKCSKTFDQKCYEKYVPNMKECIDNAWKRAGVINDNEAKKNKKVIDVKDVIKEEEEEEEKEEKGSLPNKRMAKCWMCEDTKGLARLHMECETFFCKKHSKNLGKEITKNKSKLC